MLGFEGSPVKSLEERDTCLRGGIFQLGHEFYGAN
jgi:hypothetical protein